VPNRRLYRHNPQLILPPTTAKAYGKFSFMDFMTFAPVATPLLRTAQTPTYL
jgi:hypothetical protein